MFKTNAVIEEKWNDRILSLDGWDEEAIKNAVILVAGAGAIGNETVKNLSLLGFGHIIVCDMDKVEYTNLTRTVLFNKDDLGEKKASTAAERVREMNLEPSATCDAFEGDIVHELGEGIFRRVDAILGCLDNVETRVFLNKMSVKYEVPYIDAGIGELNCYLSVMKGHKYGCHVCHNHDIFNISRFRQSCDESRRKAISSHKVPTVQTTSAIISGFQVQETLKILCGINPSYGMELFVDGRFNRILVSHMSVDSQCPCNMKSIRSDIIESNLSNNCTVGEFLSWINERGYDTICLCRDNQKAFISTVRCPNCGKQLPIYKPFFRTFHEEWYCEDCIQQGLLGDNYDNFIDDISLYEISARKAEPNILKFTLADLGIPKLQIIEVKNSETGDIGYVELTRDLSTAFPYLYSRSCKNKEGF